MLEIQKDYQPDFEPLLKDGREIVPLSMPVALTNRERIGVRDTILRSIGSRITNPAFRLDVHYNPQGHDHTKAVFRITHSGDIDERGKAWIQYILEYACSMAAYMNRTMNTESWFNDEKFEH